MASNDTKCERCPNVSCRSSNLIRLTDGYRCRKCTKKFTVPFVGAKYERLMTHDAAPPMTIGRGSSRW